MLPLQKSQISNLGKPPILEIKIIVSEIKRRTNLKNPIANQSKTLDSENKSWKKKSRNQNNYFIY